MRRYTLAGFATLGTRQSRAVEVAGESATVDATRSFVAAARHGAIEGAGGTIAATRDPLVAAARHGAIEGAGGTIAATRDPLVAAARPAAVVGVGGYLAGISAAIPDVSGGVSVSFEEVYPI